MTHATPLPPGPYLVLGCARAGESAARALAERGDPRAVLVWDGHDGAATRARRERLAALGVAVELGPWRPELLAAHAPRTVVKSPGIPADAAPVRAALAAGAAVIDELDLGRRLTRRPLVVVTGTDGKSTVCALVAGALEAVHGDTVPLAGNSERGVPLSSLPDGAGPAVVETSSYQAEFCSEPFAAVAVLTNLTVEHLHRHRSLNAYGTAKRRMFVAEARGVPRAAINVDTAFGADLACDVEAAGGRVARFGTSTSAAYRVLETSWDAHAGYLRLATPDGELELATHLPGAHNAENVAAALAACDLLELPRAAVLDALARAAGVPGRWEHVDAGQPFDAIVDFAHTPAGLRAVLDAARTALAPRAGARLHVVLCAGGGNNPGKRAPFGWIAAALADRVVVTEGNGRGEPAEQVIAEIVAAMDDGGAEVEIEPRRRAAIRRALEGAAPGDLVLVMGRGAMPRLLSSASGDGIPFDDREVVRGELERLLAAETLSA